MLRERTGAEAISPLRAAMEGIPVRGLHWHRLPTLWAPPPLAPNLPPGHEVDQRRPHRWRAWLRVALLSDTVPPLPTTTPRIVAEACADLAKLSAYTKRLGVLPDSLKHILAFVWARWKGARMGFEARDEALTATRTRLWDSALMCFRVGGPRGHERGVGLRRTSGGIGWLRVSAKRISSLPAGRPGDQRDGVGSSQ